MHFLRRYHTRHVATLLAVVVTLLAAPAGAGEGVPAGGTSLLAGDVLASFTVRHPGAQKDLGSVEVVALDDPPAAGVGRALRVTVGRNTVPEPQKWHLEVKTRQIAPTHEGDVVLLRFWARTLAGPHGAGTSDFDVSMRHGASPDEPSLVYTAMPQSHWTRYDVPFELSQASGDGGAELTFAAGLWEQTFELAGVELVNFGRGRVAVSDLPRTTQDYDGRADDAPWRAEALGRIARLRTGPLAVRVLDADGRPVTSGDVRVRMTRNAFRFGTAVSEEIWDRDDADGERYRREVTRLFNNVTPENGLKIHRFYTLPERRQTLRMLEAVTAAGLEVHGHVLVWPSWAMTRVDVRDLRVRAEAGDLEPLRWLTHEYIRDAAGRTREFVATWDVLNEPRDHNDFMRLLGEGEMAAWFRTAREVRPDADLYVNDFGILSGPPASESAGVREYLRVIRRIQADGGPLDGVGFQGHFGGPVGIPQVIETLAAFEPLGTRFMVTEFDARIADDEAYGDYLRDLLILAYSHEQFDGFIMWGFWDKSHWLRNAALFRDDWTPKAGLAHWEQLVLGEWRTDATVPLSPKGVATVEAAHHGRYVVMFGDVEAEVMHTRDEPGRVTLRLGR